VQITALETIHLGEHPNITFVQVHTDAGLVGVGETFRAPTTVAAYIHDVAAPLLLRTDPLAIEQHWQTLFTGTAGGGAQMRSTEVRGLSAIDTAVWDIAAQAAGLPLLTSVPVVEQGTIRPPDEPGLGTRLLPELKARPDAVVRVTSSV